MFCIHIHVPQMSRVLNEAWRVYEMKHKPACFLHLVIPAGSFDVNLTPDKVLRCVYMFDEFNMSNILLCCLCSKEGGGGSHFFLHCSR
jgi:DNA mismatch repair ATPase MutL